MELLIQHITQKCLQENLLEEDQAEWFRYSLERRIRNTGGFSLMIAFGSLLVPLPQVLVLNLALAFLRSKTNGLHMPTPATCCVVSLALEVVCLDLLRYAPGGVLLALCIVSTGLLLWLAPCNNKALHLTAEEKAQLRIDVRKRLAVYLAAAAVLLVAAPVYAHVLMVAETAVTLLVVLAKLKFGIQ